MTTPPCSSWVTPRELLECCTAAEGRPTVELELACEAATEWLYSRSGRQYGLCDTTLRPCRSDGPCGKGTSCGCGPLEELDLGVWPIVQVLSVRQDGALVPSGGYRVDNKRLIVRTDGGTWLGCQDLALATTAPGTLVVSVRHGTPPSALAILAARQLACELAKACAGEVCKIPTRATSVSRQGTTVSRIDPNAQPGTKLGLEQVDLFLEAANPQKLQSALRVWTPDLHPRARRAGT